jgi:hypothetical protein
MVLIIGAISTVDAFSVPRILAKGISNGELKQKHFLRGNNQYENARFAYAITLCEGLVNKKLNQDQVQQVHRAISKQNLDFDEIVDECVSMFS